MLKLMPVVAEVSWSLIV